MVRDFDFSGLPKEEIENLAAQLLRRIDPKQGIGKGLFKALIQIMPLVAIEAIVVDEISNPTLILFTWRDDEHYRGWHFPGSYIRFCESFEQTLRRLVKQELAVEVKRFKDTGLKFNNVDSRGHSICLVFLVELDGEPKDGQWFTRVSVPEELLDLHKKFLAAALGWK